MLHLVKRIWQRIFKRRKSYQQAVMDEHPIRFYLLGKEDFIEDEDQ